MQIQEPKIIVIMGPTASGKSGVSIRLAQVFNGEIISADSRQIYKDMNIGTGKVPKQESGIRNQKSEKNVYVSEGIIHHLIDVAEPMEDFNISHFKNLAEKAIEEILIRGKIPIICGGTNFWIDAVLNDSQIPEVAPNKKLRAELEEKSAEELFLELQKLDPRRAKSIDSHNKVRLVRALEIIKELGSVPVLQDTKYKIRDTKYNFLQIGIKTDRYSLNKKIQNRLDERFDEGMVQEVENLHEKGVSWEWMERVGLEYRWIARFLQNKIDETEMREKLYFDIIHYAKRQMTWLKRNKEIIWLEDYNEIEKEVAQFIKK